MRLAFYAGASSAAAAACLLKAFHQRPNFYSATVYLSQSNACLLILTNLCLVLACGFMFALQRLLYGPLRPIEIEQLSEKAWYAVLDTLLAMPSFREDVGVWLLTMFVLLLAGKVWGWIGEGRVDVLEQQPPANPRLFHARLSTSLVLSVVFDIYMLVSCIDAVLADPRPGMMVIFTFEFAIQSIFSIFTLLRYGLIVAETVITKKQTRQAIEVRKSEIRAERVAAAAARENEITDVSATSTTEEDPIEVDEQEVDVPGWEEKRRYLFMLEAISDFIKLFIYLFFFMVSITFNGLPMHIMRDVYMTFASFSKRVTDYVAYRKATSDMNTRYPDATTEEIRGDACIVCRESMVAWNLPNQAANNDAPANGLGDQAAVAAPADRRRDEGLRAKKLPCGHILHLRCLKAWLERQQVCPTCRRPVVDATETSTGPAPNQDGQAQQGGQQPPQPHNQQQHQHQQHQHQQQRQQPPARPNRARIFNFGPIRVGLLNAPNGQLQNIVDQLRNPDARNPDAPGPTNQQAPDVSAAGQQGEGSRASIAPSGGRGARASVPTQIQLMQIEQRLLYEAHNLGIEQQQLATLRLMEAELARLRAHHIPTQIPVGMQRRSLPATGLQGFQPEVLQGNPTLQLGSGHDALPSGLTLPEGWSIMPLHRVGGGLQVQNVTMHPPRDQEAPIAASDNHLQSTSGQNPATVPEAPSNPEQTATSASSGHANINQGGPTDDNGSPLFIPTAESSENPPLLDNATETHGNLPRPDQQESKAPWTASDGWSFSDSKAENGSLSLESEQRYPGKGKGKAVEIEDAPDPDAGSSR